MIAAYKIDRDAVGWLGSAQQASTDRSVDAGRRIADAAAANAILD